MGKISIPEQPQARLKPEWPWSRKLKVWVYQFVIPILVFPIVRLITVGYRWRLKGEPEAYDLGNSGKPFAIAIWHGDMVHIQSMGRYLGWNKRVVIMVSLSQAGEVETRILKLLGYNVIRGSQKERGKQALKEMMSAVEQGAIPVFAVDGPSGPHHKVKAGVIYLAKNCQVPIIPIAFMPGKEWKLPTWDSTRIPYPLSKCLATSAKPIEIPKDLDDDQFDAWAQKVTDYMLDLTKQDIAWDTSDSPDIINTPDF